MKNFIKSSLLLRIALIFVLATPLLAIAQVGTWPVSSNYLYFGANELNQGIVGNYSLLQDKSSGLTFLNSPLETRFRIGNNDKMILTNSGLFGIGTQTPSTLLSLGSSIVAKKFSLYDFPTDWYGFGIQDHQVRLQVASGARFSFFTGDTNEIFTIKSDGTVGIGTTSTDAKLTVNGQIHATEVKVTTTVPGPDYVFEKSFALPSLEEVKSYIDENKHLPEVPSAKEMEKNGINVAEMNMLLLKKVEELTLYLMEQNKLNALLTNRLEKLETELKELKQK